MGKRFSDGTWGARVRGVYRTRKLHPTRVDLEVGDGRFGYATRPAGEGVTQTESVVDGKPFNKSSRANVAHHKKNGCRLASRVHMLGRDALLALEQAVPNIMDEVRRVASRPRFRARRGQKPRGQ